VGQTRHTVRVRILSDEREPRLEIGNGIAVKPNWTIEADDFSIPAVVRINVTFDEDKGRFVAASVHVERDEGSEVTGAMLREIRVQENIQSAGKGLVWVRQDDGSLLTAADDLARVRPIEGRTRDEHVPVAMRIYRLASVLGYPPLKSVADLLHVSQSTATRLIARGREEGEPDASVRGRKVYHASWKGLERGDD